MASPVTTLPLDPARAVDVLQLVSDVVDPVHESASIHLELGLARSPRADTASLLGERTTGAAKSGQPVLQKRELDLGLAFGRASVLGEDVQNDRGSVDRGASEDLLQVALLSRREVVLEDHRVRVDRQTDLAQLVDLSRTEERGGIGSVTTLNDARHHVGAGGVNQ